MTDVFEQARALIEAAPNHPDPEGAMEALEYNASADDKAMFPALWEALILKMNEPVDDLDQDDD